MINLLNLLTTDVDNGTPGVTTQADGETHFLALLTGALGTEQSKSVKTLAAELSDESNGKTPTKTSITAWLLQQESAQTPPDLPDGTTADTQSLLSQLASHLKSDLQETNTSNDSDDSGTVSEESLAGISALMAMLPAVPPTPPAATPVNDTATGLNGITPRGGEKFAGTPTASQDTAQTLAGRELPAVAQTAPQIAPVALKVEAESTPTATAPTTPLSTLVSTPVQTTPPLPVATVQASLGSTDWQQSVSQHITLFTRQGQQTAELRLHPEDLGQVHISLKLDDNQAQIQMVSPHSHVRAALEAALPVLRTQLAESGIQLGQSSISSESFAGQQQHASGQQFASRTPPTTDEDEELLTVPVSLQSAASRGDGRVDIFA